MSADSDHGEWRALVAVTTCDREAYLRRCLPELAIAVINDQRLSMVVSLDGDDPATRSFCDAWSIPLIYSDAREGVGISKNRVLESFPGFDYYFFLEDDVEVLDGDVFAAHVEIARAGGLHHMSLFERSGLRGQVSESLIAGFTVAHARYGGAQFNFFTGEGLRIVGGWHPRFAQYRRWGHTEHSYRFPRNHLAPEPFNVAVALADAYIPHSPPSVTLLTDAHLDADQIVPPERDLMDAELLHVDLETIAPYHLNMAPLRPPERLAKVAATRRYALLSRSERRHALSDRLIWAGARRRGAGRKLLSLVLGITMAPTSPAAKHAVKSRLMR